MPVAAFAEDTTSLRKLFTSLDTVNGGNWFSLNNNNTGSSFTWGESYVMDSYLYMYEATKDKHYLDKLVSHANGVLSWRDNKKGYTDYRGLSLPAWSTIAKGKKMHYPAEGMITYPMVKFAYMVKSDPNLASYKGVADTYIKAAEDFLKVFDGDWVDKGTTGYYIFTKGSPDWCDGIEAPFNMNLAMARTHLYLYLNTKNSDNLDKTTKLAQLFKTKLEYVSATNAYKWRYWFGSGLTGWTSSQNLSINTPSYGGYRSYEDLSHGAIDIQFAYEAYQAGIVFNEQDMVRFGNTLEKYVIRSNGTFAVNVDGVNNIDISSFPYGGIGNYLSLHKYAPSLYPAAYKIYSAYTSTQGGGLQSVALLNRAYAERNAATTPTPSPTPTPDEGELIVNGDFTGSSDWSGLATKLKTDTAGNKYVSNGYSFDLFQDVTAKPNTSYTLTGKVLKGTSTTPARICVIYYDNQNKKLASKDILYTPVDSSWGAVANNTFTTPANTSLIRVFLLTNGGTGSHSFDNISLKEVGLSTPTPTPVPTPVPNIPEPPTALKAVAEGMGNQVQLSWSASTSTEVSYYKVYRSTTAVTKGSIVGDNVAATSWTDSGLTEGTTYYYTVTACDKAGNESKGTQFSFTPNVAPAVPTNITTSVLDTGYQISLTWTASASSDVNSYKIYRSTSLVNKGDLVKNVINNTWVDSSVTEGQLYYYSISAVDKAGNESAGFQQIQILPVVKPVTPLYPKAILGKTVTSSELTVNGSFTATAGWNGQTTKVKKEANGNSYVSNGYAFDFYQDVPAKANTTYTLGAQARKGTATSAARLAVIYLDAKKSTISSTNVFYTPGSTTWTSIPDQTLITPANTAYVRIFLLVNGGKGTHDFDNISLKEPQLSAPISVSWSASTSADTSFYRIYRSTSAGQVGSLVGNNLTNTVWTDTATENKTNYYYTVCAVDKAGNESVGSQQVQAGQDLILNGDFSSTTGWGGISSKVFTETNNAYVSNGYNFNLYRDIAVTPGEKYALNAKTRKGTATANARLSYQFLDAQGKSISYSDNNVLYSLQSNTWENIPTKFLTPPQGTVKMRLFILVNGGTGTHDFDDISLIPAN